MKGGEAILQRRKGKDNQPVPHPSKSLVPDVKLIALMSNLFQKTRGVLVKFWRIRF